MKKISNWSLLTKIIYTAPKGITFQNNWSTYCIPIPSICRQPKHHQLRIRSEILILLEIILNAFNVWQYHFRLKTLFWQKCHFRLFQFASSVNLLCCYMCTFYCPLRNSPMFFSICLGKKKKEKKKKKNAGVIKFLAILKKICLRQKNIFLFKTEKQCFH